MRIEDEIKQSKFNNEYHKLIVNILYTSNWIERLHNKVLRPYDISQQQYNILRILRGRRPDAATITLLQNRMLDKMSNASRLVEKLRQKNLVKRVQDDKDRRQVKVTITEKGLTLLEELDVLMKNMENEFSHLSEKEAQTVNNKLDKIRSRK